MNLQVFIGLITNQFLKQYQTELIGGYAEPFYQPADSGKLAQIQFTRDYYRSALHELAHWCIAGERRRKLPDYGYWYEPDGRSQQQQEAFYQLEIKPQAIEWGFATLCGIDFDVSVDNVNRQVNGLLEFRQAVKLQCHDYLKSGFPDRAEAIMRLIYEHQQNSSVSLSGDKSAVYQFLSVRFNDDG